MEKPGLGKRPPFTSPHGHLCPEPQRPTDKAHLSSGHPLTRTLCSRGSQSCGEAQRREESGLPGSEHWLRVLPNPGHSGSCRTGHVSLVPLCRAPRSLLPVSFQPVPCTPLFAILKPKQTFEVRTRPVKSVCKQLRETSDVPLPHKTRIYSSLKSVARLTQVSWAENGPGAPQAQTRARLTVTRDLSVPTAHAAPSHPPPHHHLPSLASQPAVTIKVSLGNRLRLATRGAPPGPAWS